VRGYAGPVGGGKRKQVRVEVMHYPMLAPRQPWREPPAHRAGATAEVVDHPATVRPRASRERFDEITRARGGVSGLTQRQPLPADGGARSVHRDAPANTSA